MSTTRPDAFADLWCVILFYIGHLFTPKGMMKMYQSQKSYHRCGRGGQQLECEDGMPWQSKVYRSLDVPVCKKTSAPEIFFIRSKTKGIQWFISMCPLPRQRQ